MCKRHALGRTEHFLPIVLSMDPTQTELSQAGVLLAGSATRGPLQRAFARRGQHVYTATPDHAIAAMREGVEAVVIEAPGSEALALCQRLKTRFQVPFLPVIVLQRRPARLAQEQAAPDAWLDAGTPLRDVVMRVEELVRIRRTECELVRLNSALAELAAENGRLYDRARRDAEATTLLLRELQHRVRNNLASIQALLILERHRAPARSLGEALDVAIGRLRSMAALQDSLTPTSREIDLGALARSVARSAIDVFGATDGVQFDVHGDARLPARVGGPLAIALNELVTNSLKHAHASHLTVHVIEGEAGLQLVVADDGCGMPAEPSGGSGLMIVRAVVRNELGGSLSFATEQPGTRVSILVPRERTQLVS
ncbi:MAG: sensor histidine kinase [Gemmatimonadaceae bacterium]